MENRPYLYKKSSSQPPVLEGVPFHRDTSDGSVVKDSQASIRINPPFNFLGLPAEIRNNIYEIYMRENVDLRIRGNDEVDSKDSKVGPRDSEVESGNGAVKPSENNADFALDAFCYPVLTRVSRQFRAETIQRFITDTRLRVSIRPGDLNDIGGIQRPEDGAHCEIVEESMFRDINFGLHPIPIVITFADGEVYKWHFTDIELYIHINVHPSRKTPLMDVKWHDIKPRREKFIPHTRETLCEDLVHDMLANVYSLVETMFRQKDFQGLRLTQLDQIANALTIKAVASRTKMPANITGAWPDKARESAAK